MQHEVTQGNGAAAAGAPSATIQADKAAPRHDPAERPQSTFWLDSLHVARFPRLIELMDDHTALVDAFDKRWSDKADAKVAQQILERDGDTAATRLNLVLLAEFIASKKGEALREVARAAIAPDLLKSHVAFKGQGRRLAAAGLVYHEDPLRLLDIELWDIWHPRRRCSLKLRGQRRKPTFSFPSLGWEDTVAAALATTSLLTDNLKFWRAFERPWAGDVIVALTEPGFWDTHRGPDGHLRSGPKDQWMFLRFHEQMHRVDVTARKLDRGIALASAIASTLWGVDREYRYARDPLSRARLDQFLGRLCDPDDDTFVLHEITAEVPGRWRHPILRAGNTGKERVEQIVRDLQQKYAYAKCSKTVHKAKVGFDCDDRHYRIELHFPLPDAGEKELVIAYGDRGWSVDKASKFAQLMLSELGVEIHPKAPNGKAPKRPSHYPTRPKKKDVDYWRRLLLPHLDDPADWQREALDKLQGEGLVTCVDSAIFRCGDPHIPVYLRPDHTNDCPGIVTMPFASVSTSAPFLQQPGEEHPCDTCGHSWRLDGFQPPAFHRLTVSVNADDAWAHVVGILTTRAWAFGEDAKGVLSRLSGGRREYVIFPRLAGDAWRYAGRAAVDPVCWFDIEVGDVEIYGPRGVTLAEVLANKGTPIRAALELGTAGAVAGPPAASTAAAPPVGAAPSCPAAAAPGPVEADLTVRLIQAGDEGIYLGDVKFVDERQQRVALLFALLQEATSREAAKFPRQRAYHTAKALADLDAGFLVEEQAIHQWVSRARKALNVAFPGQMLGKQVIESGGRKGIRLGPQYECRGFVMQDELSLYKTSRAEG